MVRGAYRAWGGLGGDPVAFWALTPWQTSVWTEGAAEMIKARSRDGLALAWHGAALTAAASVGRLPPLAEVVAEKPKRMTADQIAATLKAMAKRSRSDG